MPSAKKPAARRQGKSGRTRDVGRLQAVADLEVPDPPKVNGKPMLASTRDAWEAFWCSPALAGMVLPADRPALDRLFKMYNLREQMERKLLRSPFMEGSTGQPVVNPAAKEIASLDGRILALEDRFGITPMARLKLGVEFGRAKQSLDDLNRGFDADDDEAEEEDPRLRVIDV